MILRPGRRPALAALLAALPLALCACGVRLGDARGISRRVAPAAADNPASRPGVREQREAKAAAMQEWDSLLNGGLPQYRGDGSSSNINSVKFGSAAEALTLDCYASPRLNFSSGEPHALTLVVYHLSDRAAFDQLARHEEGLRKLLEADFFDASVAGVRKHTVQPGTQARILENRYEGGRYVALVAGYASLRARTSAYVTEYRLYQWHTEGESIFSRDRVMYSPYPLRLRAVLDEDEMRVDDTDATLERMRAVTSMQREQVYARFRPATRSEVANFFENGRN